MFQRSFYVAVSAACVLSIVIARARADVVEVTAAQTPNAGLQPQVAVDDKNVAHLIYLKGDPSATDIFYVRSADGGATWSEPVRVNSQAGSAIAMGTVRGAHLALGRQGLIHVAWTSSKGAEPKGPGDQGSMLYARGSADASGKVTFEPQRNVMTSGLFREGGSVAADDKGHVYVAWHALAKKGGNEDNRRVFVAVSADDGKSFSPETAISDQAVGVCGCCGLDVIAGGDGRLYALYRGEINQATRDMYLATSTDVSAIRPESEKVALTRSSTCLMSTSSLARGPSGVVGAWETTDRVQWAVIDTKTGRMSEPVTVARAGSKHPALAVDTKGETLVAWAEGTGWNKGGSVSWQVYDAAGTPIRGASGRVDGLPVWSKPAAFAGPGGGFVVLY